MDQKTNFPARQLYERTLPNIVKRLCGTAYHPGSPWGGNKTCSDPTVGDVHEWRVWHGTQEAYQDWDKLGGRFVSEFGKFDNLTSETTTYTDNIRNARIP